MSPAWIDHWERRAGFLAMPGLAMFLAGMNAVVGVLTLVRPEFPARLYLEPAALLAGEVWRSVTFLFIPPPTAPLWLAVWVLMIYSLMGMLERTLGEFRFTLYLLVGAAATSLAALASGLSLSSGPLQLSVFLAFAHLHPELEVRLFFILPVKVRWLAVAGWVYAAGNLAWGDAFTRIGLLSGLANYAVFFAAEHTSDWRGALRRRRPR
ncbi:MAG: hypothetical protein WC881_11860 [Elusimicrobiota bacterium]|jgi:hypothetical protein